MLTNEYTHRMAIMPWRGAHDLSWPELSGEVQHALEMPGAQMRERRFEQHASFCQSRWALEKDGRLLVTDDRLKGGQGVLLPGPKLRECGRNRR